MINTGKTDQIVHPFILRSWLLIPTAKRAAYLQDTVFLEKPGDLASAGCRPFDFRSSIKVSSKVGAPERVCHTNNSHKGHNFHAPSTVPHVKGEGAITESPRRRRPDKTFGTLFQCATDVEHRFTEGLRHRRSL